jgi:hypothetical protein
VWGRRYVFQGTINRFLYSAVDGHDALADD